MPIKTKHWEMKSMWTTEHTEQTDVAPTAIWAALRDLHEGVVEAPGGDRFEIHGPFAVGTEISVTPAGQDTFRSTIVELEEERRYADETAFGDVTLRFAHTLAPVDGGGTRITHELRISGPGAATVGPELGPQISEDFPAAMQALIATARAAADSR
jgi:hypothetical protein